MLFMRLKLLTGESFLICANFEQIEYFPAVVVPRELQLASKVHFLIFCISSMIPSYIIVPTPLEGRGGGTIYSNGFFLFREFWPTDIFIVEKCAWYH